MQHVNVILTEHTHTHSFVAGQVCQLNLALVPQATMLKLPQVAYTHPEKRKRERERKGEAERHSVFAFFYRRVVSKEMLSLSSTVAYAVALD